MKPHDLPLRSFLLHTYIEQLETATANDVTALERQLRHVLWLTLEAGDQSGIDAAWDALTTAQRQRFFQYMAETLFEREIAAGQRCYPAQAFAIPLILTSREPPFLGDPLPGPQTVAERLGKFNRRSASLVVQGELYRHAELVHRNEVQLYRLMNEMLQKPLLGEPLSPTQIYSPRFDPYSLQFGEVWVSLRYLFGVRYGFDPLGVDLTPDQRRELEATILFLCEGDACQTLAVKVLDPQRPDVALDTALPAFARAVLRRIHADMPHPSHPVIFVDRLEREVRLGMMEEVGDVIAAAVALPEGRPEVSATLMDAVSEEGKALGLPPVEMVCLDDDNPIVSHDGVAGVRYV